MPPEADPAGQAPPQDPPAGGTPPPAPPTPAGPEPAGEGTPSGGEQPPLDAAALQAELQKVRQEAAARRVSEREAQQQAKDTQERLAAIQKALGGEGDDPDPAQLANEVQQLQTQLRTERVTNAVQAAAQAAGADVALLVPYLRGTGALDNLNQDDPEQLRTAVATLVTETVKERPQFQVNGATPARSGGEAPGGQPPQRKFSRAEIAAMTPKQLEDNQEAIDAWLAAGAPE